MVKVGNREEGQRALLTSWFVRNRAMGNPVPAASYANAQGLSPLPVPRRADLLLRFIESCIPEIGQDFVFENRYQHRIQANIASPSWQHFRAAMTGSSTQHGDKFPMLPVLGTKAPALRTLVKRRSDENASKPSSSSHTGKFHPCPLSLAARESRYSPDS